MRRVDLIHLYEVDGKRYGVVTQWHEHQRIQRGPDGKPVREGVSRLPEPPQNCSSSAAAPVAALRKEVEVEVEVQVQEQTPPTPPTPEPDATEDEEAARSITIADRRRANRHSTAILAQQHTEVKHALDDLQSVYSWKPTKYAIIADRVLTLARDHGTERTAGAINKCLSSGADIRDPLAYVTKLLSDTPPTPLAPAKPKHDLDAIFGYDERPVN
jgi:hypothetical protein